MTQQQSNKQDTKAISPTDTIVVVTGITGFLGSHIAVQLLQQGYQVRGTLRSMKRAPQIKSLIQQHSQADLSRLTLFEADLLDDTGWDQAVEGADYLIHTASPFLSYLPKHEDELIKPAVEGTKRVLQAAEHHQLKRVVLTSSIAAIIYGDGQAPFTETDWSVTDSNKVTPYFKSKTLAEQTAWEFVQEKEMELAVINPGAILGPVLEQDYGTSAEIVVKLMKGDFLGVPKIGFSTVDVRDVADLHIRAMCAPNAAGERFIAASDFMWFSEIAEILRGAYPDYAKLIPKRTLPSWLVRIVSRFDPAIKTVLKDLDRERTLSNQKAKTMLDWQPRSSQEAVQATANSLIKLKII